MPVYIALLRGINVGGKRMKMADLRDMFTNIGFQDVQTLLASGNVIFQTKEDNQGKLVADIENAIQLTFGFDSKIIIRTLEQIEAVITKNPFNMDEIAGNRLLVTFLRDTPSNEAIQAFEEFHQTNEAVHISDEEIFIHYPDGAGQSKLSNNVIEKKLDIVGTARNWNTVIKIRALASKVE